MMSSSNWESCLQCGKEAMRWEKYWLLLEPHNAVCLNWNGVQPGFPADQEREVEGGGH